ncbi:---NA--- [Podarcis lilfordi]|uniref:---NA n=1 Tax=Podarcis lilfordi TaxID=74358 RepID=A0AA35P3X8_9SAUR|nr:---NA--- [Podarcis lilfordi]
MKIFCAFSLMLFIALMVAPGFTRYLHGDTECMVARGICRHLPCQPYGKKIGHCLLNTYCCKDYR